jgi:hypothetical protein
MIAFLDLRTHLRFIDLIATSGKLFFAVTGLSYCHRLDLSFNIFLQFNPRVGGTIVAGRSEKREWLGSTLTQLTIYPEERGE